MQIGRRGFLARVRAFSVLALLGAGVAAPVQALALSEDEATAHVRATIDEVVALVSSAGDPASKAPMLLSIMERRAAMPEIARFAAGTAWRAMSDDQQKRYTAAFAKFLSANYAGRFQQYSGTGANGKQYEMGNVVDAGKKGLLVKTTIYQTQGPPVAVEWLVSDKPGRIVVADIVIEGVSMLVTEREQVSGMLEARGGSVDKLIDDLGA